MTRYYLMVTEFHLLVECVYIHTYRKVSELEECRPFRTLNVLANDDLHEGWEKECKDT